eukprot:9484214-Pyramimonas_sp.AAC.2
MPIDISNGPFMPFDWISRERRARGPTPGLANPILPAGLVAVGRDWGAGTSLWGAGTTVARGEPRHVTLGRLPLLPGYSVTVTSYDVRNAQQQQIASNGNAEHLGQCFMPMFHADA